jgi:hypothetical protein
LHAVVSLVVATVAGVAFDVNEGDTTFATSVFCTKGFVAQGRDAFVSLGLPDATRNVASVHGVVADGEGLVTTLASSPEKCVEHATQSEGAGKRFLRAFG